MSFLFDILVEVILEGIFHGILSVFAFVADCFLPQKAPSEKTSDWIVVAAVVTTLACLVAFFAGIILLISNRGHGFWGWFLLSLSMAYVLLGLTVNEVKKHKKR